MHTRGMSPGMIIAIFSIIIISGGWYFANRLGAAEEMQRDVMLNDTGQEAPYTQ